MNNQYNTIYLLQAAEHGMLDRITSYMEKHPKSVKDIGEILNVAAKFNNFNVIECITSLSKNKKIYNYVLTAGLIYDRINIIKYALENGANNLAEMDYWFIKGSAQFESSLNKIKFLVEEKYIDVRILIDYEKTDDKIREWAKKYESINLSYEFLQKNLDKSNTKIQKKKI